MNANFVRSTSKQKLEVSLKKTSRSNSLKSTKEVNTCRINISVKSNIQTYVSSAKKQKLSLVKVKAIRKIKDFDLDEY